LQLDGLIGGGDDDDDIFGMSISEVFRLQELIVGLLEAVGNIAIFVECRLFYPGELENTDIDLLGGETRA
jgi:hypothetical protein